jgi:hypothetical protein
MGRAPSTSARSTDARPSASTGSDLSKLMTMHHRPHSTISGQADRLFVILCPDSLRRAWRKPVRQSAVSAPTDRWLARARVAQAAGITPRASTGSTRSSCGPDRGRGGGGARRPRSIAATIAARQAASGRRDLAVRKRPTEVDHLMGWVTPKGARGIALPSTSTCSRRSRTGGVSGSEDAQPRRAESRRAAVYGPGIGSH